MVEQILKLVPALNVKDAFTTPEQPDVAAIRPMIHETREQRIADERPALLVFLSGLTHRFFE
jgi:hypothetical protein